MVAFTSTNDRRVVGTADDDGERLTLGSSDIIILGDVDGTLDFVGETDSEGDPDGCMEGDSVMHLPHVKGQLYLPFGEHLLVFLPINLQFLLFPFSIVNFFALSVQRQYPHVTGHLVLTPGILQLSPLDPATLQQKLV